jgi:2,3-dihydroxybenzoate-AMP ligase
MILDSEERIKKYEGMGVWGKGTMLDRLEEAVEKCPEREAFVDPPNRKDLTGRLPERITDRE